MPTGPDLAAVDPDAIADELPWLDELDDASLLSAAADVLARPRASAPDSFVLHAPLEILARATLLQHCSPAVRDTARRRLAWVAARFAQADAPAPAGAGVEPIDEADAVGRLADAVRHGELDDAQAAGAWLGTHVDAMRLAGLVGDLVAPSLAAAGHGSIFLQSLPRIGSRTTAGTMFGTLARELARNPDMGLTWIDQRDTPVDDRLADAVATTPPIGIDGPAFIHPTMDQVEANGMAAELVGPHLGGDVVASARALLRVSTESMRLDDPDQAPYGWSHTLTMPLAVAVVAPLVDDPRRLLAVAATHVVGFRAALGRAPLVDLRDGAPAPATDRFDLSLPPAQAAATFAAADAEQRHRALRRIIDLAAVHPDAHLAKYVVACLDVARLDPEGAIGHLAAAAHLASWWWSLVAHLDDPMSARVRALPTS